jgi:ornithine cyclodeaminase/alanine dehydrogenase
MEETTGRPVEVCSSPEEAVRNADIIITTTPSRTPVIKREWVRPGAHIIAVGADMEGKQELDVSLFQGAKIVVDNRDQCITRGETRNPLKSGIIDKADIYAEIGGDPSGS